MKKIFHWIRQTFHSMFSKRLFKRSPSSPQIESLRKMVAQILSTRDVEIACRECYEQLDKFAELILDGKEPQEAMSLVQDHLSRCGDCREELEALVAALKAQRKLSSDS